MTLKSSPLTTSKMNMASRYPSATPELLVSTPFTVFHSFLLFSLFSNPFRSFSLFINGHLLPLAAFGDNLNQLNYTHTNVKCNG